MRQHTNDTLGDLISFSLIAFILAAYMTHIIETLMSGDLGWFLVGLFVPPIGVVNGVLIWFA